MVDKYMDGANMNAQVDWQILQQLVMYVTLNLHKTFYPLTVVVVQV
jgi:glycine cleavage system protein P-like pyridoxal-binding family